MDKHSAYTPNNHVSDRDTYPQNTHWGQCYFQGVVSLSDQPILTMVNLVLETAYIRPYKPISLLLLGNAGIGKTRLLSPLAKLDFVSYVNDITPKYLVEFLEKVKKGDKRFLVVPDFTSCLSHAMNTRTVLVAILRSMTEEGVINLADYHLEFKSDFHVKAGLITATTNASYQQFREIWKGTGFLSRLLPFSFNHSGDTKVRIMDDIDEKVEDCIESVKLSVVKRPKLVNMPSHLLRQLRAYEELLGKNSGSLPYRHQIQLNKITESLVVLTGNSELTQGHIDTVSKLCHWINYDFNEV
jgi:hypothetical protein